MNIASPSERLCEAQKPKTQEAVQFTQEELVRIYMLSYINEFGSLYDGSRGARQRICYVMEDTMPDLAQRAQVIADKSLSTKDGYSADQWRADYGF